MFARITAWLKGSGIKYPLAYGRPFQGEEMIDSLNPLDAVVEHPEYPMARIYREGFWTGVTDTYHVLMGNHYDLRLTGHGRKGVLDLLIFPVISRRLLGFSYNDEHNFFLRAIAGVIGYIPEIPRGLLGIVLTAALTPIVAIVHAVIYSKAKNFTEKIQNLETVKQPREDLAPGEELKRSLLDARLNLKSKVIKPDYKRHFPKNAAAAIVERLPPPDESQEEAAAEQQATKNAVTDQKTIPAADRVIRLAIHGRYFEPMQGRHIDNAGHDCLIEMKKKNRDGIKALLATNTAHILDRLKAEPGALQQVEEWIIEPEPKKAARKAFMTGALGPSSEQSASSSNGFFNDKEQYDSNLVTLLFYTAGLATKKQAEDAKKIIAAKEKEREQEQHITANGLN